MSDVISPLLYWPRRILGHGLWGGGCPTTEKGEHEQLTCRMEAARDETWAVQHAIYGIPMQWTFEGW